MHPADAEMHPTQIQTQKSDQVWRLLVDQRPSAPTTAAGGITHLMEVDLTSQPSLTETRDTVTSLSRLLLRDLGHEISTVFVSPSTIFKLMYLNRKLFSMFHTFCLT